ncbi:hypothetical protein QTP70_030846, partial [Hemibagrus guttatus]
MHINDTLQNVDLLSNIFDVFFNACSCFCLFLVPPVVSVSADPPAVAGDTDVILATCTTADAKPAAEVSWRLGALNNLVKVQNYVTVNSEGRYTVKNSLVGNASKDLNQKEVQCVVTHPALKEKLELSYKLNVHYPPQVVYIISAGDQRETHEFHCEAEANPKPTNFTWSRYFPVNETLSSGVNSRLIIQLTPDSNDFYYCVASNQYGNAVGSLYMHVIPCVIVVILCPLNLQTRKSLRHVCGVCMFCPCLGGFLRVPRFPPPVQRH